MKLLFLNTGKQHNDTVSSWYEWEAETEGMK
jgi:hypothetical protein